MNIVNICLDWKQGATVMQIRNRYGITREQAWAILECSSGLYPHEIYQRLLGVKSGMKAKRIKGVMLYRWETKSLLRVALKQFNMAWRLKSSRVFLIGTRSLWLSLRSLRYNDNTMKACLVGLFVIVAGAS